MIPILIVLTIAGAGAFTFFQWKMEADTFNRYKSDKLPDATWVDAAFSELRVEAN